MGCSAEEERERGDDNDVAVFTLCNRWWAYIFLFVMITNYGAVWTAVGEFRGENVSK